MLDERARYHHRLRRLRGAARRWTVLAGGFTGTAAVLVPYQGLGAVDALWAGLAGASVVLAGWRWSDARALAAQPEPDPPPPASAALADDRWLSLLSRVGAHQLAENIQRQRTRHSLRGSAAAEAWERLDRSARTMWGLTTRLGGMEPEAVREAAAVERELRDMTGRIAALEQALRLAPADAQPSLRELRSEHITRLTEGVTAYEQFVVAAADFVSESARAAGTGGRVAVTGLNQATDRLRGVTAGLAELRRLYGDLRAPG